MIKYPNNLNKKYHYMTIILKNICKSIPRIINADNITFHIKQIPFPTLTKSSVIRLRSPLQNGVKVGSDIFHLKKACTNTVQASVFY